MFVSSCKGNGTFALQINLGEAGLWVSGERGGKPCSWLGSPKYYFDNTKAQILLKICFRLKSD